MAVTRVGAAVGSGTSMTLPTHQADDVAIMWASQIGNTVPSLPAGWTSLRTATSSSGNVSGRLAWRVLPGSGTGSGTWTNAQHLTVAIYRGSDGAGASAINSAEDNATINYPGLSMNVTDGSSWAAGFNTRVRFGSSNDPGSTGPSGMGTRASQPHAGSSGSPRWMIHDTNGGVSSWSSTNVAMGASGGFPVWCSATVEILATPDPVGPEITSVTPDEFTPGTSGIVIAGSNFSASGNTVELGDSSNYVTATLVEQTITAEGASSITFTHVLGAHSPGSLWAYVTDDDDNVSEPAPVTLLEPPGPPPPPPGPPPAQARIWAEVF